MYHKVSAVYGRGVFADACRRKTILDELKRGHCYVSDAPALDFRCGRAQMGDVIRPRGKQAEMSIEAANMGGLRDVRLISDGVVVQEWSCGGVQRFRKRWKWSITQKPSYIRLEVQATDARGAFSNPIYVR